MPWYWRTQTRGEDWGEIFQGTNRAHHWDLLEGLLSKCPPRLHCYYWQMCIGKNKTKFISVVCISQHMRETTWISRVVCFRNRRHSDMMVLVLRILATLIMVIQEKAKLNHYHNGPICLNNAPTMKGTALVVAATDRWDFKTCLTKKYANFSIHSIWHVRSQ